MKKAAKATSINNVNNKMEALNERTLKKVATSKTNSHIKDHRKILNEIFYLLLDSRIDEKLKSDNQIKVNELTEEFTKKLDEIRVELQFVKEFAGYTETQKEIVKKMLGL
jgi:hypothetical protein